MEGQPNQVAERRLKPRIFAPLHWNLPAEWLRKDLCTVEWTFITVPSWGTAKDSNTAPYAIKMDNETRVLTCPCEGFFFRGVCHHIRGLIWFCSKPARKRGRQDTQDASYHEFTREDLERKASIVYDCIQKCGPISLRKIAEELGWGEHRVTGRLKELRDMALVGDCGKVHDDITDREVYEWMVIK